MERSYRSIWSAISYQRGRLLLWKSVASLCRLQIEETSRVTEMTVHLRARSGPLAIGFYPGRKKTISQVFLTIPGPPGFIGMRIRSHY